MFKKGNKQEPNKYRSIYLLNTILKFPTKMITNKISNSILFVDEQDFRSKRSYTNTIFILR